MDAGTAIGTAPGRLRLEDFDYPLPPELIAQEPPVRRDDGRLLVVDRSAGSLCHSSIRALPAMLRPGDLLVFNDSRVLPARLVGRTATGGAAELLLVSEVDPGRWSCLGKPAKRLRVGAVINFGSAASAEVVDVSGEGRYAVQFAPAVDVASLLAEHGEIPLPPYIKRPHGPSPIDRDRYQTVFAVPQGAVAAPTAGLHFTRDLLTQLGEAGVETAWLTLHVGPATFLPVRAADVESYPLEAERAVIPPATDEAVRKAKAEGRRVVAVGTTTTRALESAARRPGRVLAGELSADAFITPGFSFRIVDALLTNFHLPKSTLLMLVSALADRQTILDAYGVAVRERYRFYSYGDAMFVI